MKKNILYSCVLSVCLLFSACAGNRHVIHNAPIKIVRARITTYSQNEHGSDRWTKKLQSSTGVILQDRRCVAADPKIFPYFSQIKLPCFDHPLTIVDTGGDVVRKKAALAWGVDCPVVDLFFRYERDAAAFRARNPMFMDILVVSNNN